MEKWLKKSSFKTKYFIQDDVLTYKSLKKYDIIFSSGFIEHFENFEEVIRIHTRLVKDKWYVIITAPNFAGSVQKYLHEKLDKKNLDRHNLKAMDVKKWEEIVTDEGFKIIKSGYFGGFDFWTDKEKRSIWRWLLVLLLKIFPPLRFIPNSQHYSPEIILIAKKNTYGNDI